LFIPGEDQDERRHKDQPDHRCDYRREHLHGVLRDSIVHSRLRNAFGVRRDSIVDETASSGGREMTDLTTDKKVAAWPRQEAVDRVVSCKTMLALHGFLTDAESRKVTDRIRKWIVANSNQVEE
jgi:hypothetical protein